MSARRWPARGGILVWIALVVLVAPTPVRAHVGGGPEPSNYRVRVTGLSPPIPAVRLRVGPGGQWVQLVNRGKQPVTVLGYDGEPFLRVSPEGVRVNGASSVLADNPGLDRSTAGRTGARAGRGGAAWRHVADDNRVTWKDARVAAGAVDGSPASAGPDDEREDPRERARSGEWQLRLRAGGTAVTVTGTRTWVPAPAPWPWYVLFAGLAAAIGAASWMRRWRAVAVPVLCLAGAVNATHLTGVALSAPPGSGLAAWGGVVMTGILCWPLMVVAVVATLRRSEHAAFAVAVAGAVLVIFSGSDLGVFRHSQLSFAWTAPVERFLVAAALGAGVGLTLGGLRLIYRQAGRGDDGQLEYSTAAAGE